MSSSFGMRRSLEDRLVFVCGLRRHSYIVRFKFWEFGLLDLWVRQLDALANDREHQGILFDQGRTES
jgi:hypothetical protein